MPIEFRCPSCSKLLRTPDESVGQKAKCPQCGMIAEVPLASVDRGASASQPLAPVPVGRPAESPFAKPSAVASATSETPNPYRSPAPDSFVSEAGRGGLTPKGISFDLFFKMVWGVYRPQLTQMVIAGLIVTVAIFGSQIAAAVANFAAQSTKATALIVVVYVLGIIVTTLVQTWIGVGAAIYMLKAARNVGPTSNDFAAAGPFFLRVLVMQLFIQLVFIPVIALFLAPAGYFYFVRNDVLGTIVAGAIGLMLAMIPLTLIFYRWLIASFFIIDCNMNIMESLANSSRFMAGNKLTAFLIITVVGLLGSLLGLCVPLIGIVLFFAYVHLVFAGIYLTATGQQWGPELAKPVAK